MKLFVTKPAMYLTLTVNHYDWESANAWFVLLCSSSELYTREILAWVGCVYTLVLKELCLTASSQLLKSDCCKEVPGKQILRAFSPPSQQLLRLSNWPNRPSQERKEMASWFFFSSVKTQIWESVPRWQRNFVVFSKMKKKCVIDKLSKGGQRTWAFTNSGFTFPAIAQ